MDQRQPEQKDSQSRYSQVNRTLAPPMATLQQRLTVQIPFLKSVFWTVCVILTVYVHQSIAKREVSATRNRSTSPSLDTLAKSYECLLLNVE
ncbi:hypothetical protein CPB83DRAFT_22257 [Crepidotus variabilis]|uniref:Uncharacterized protein n=1 Tax=Crepidotus variabilis TaxID=179855 RepID=A0A9P6JX68_9AGAR|nr:hypothetical protein CPB83DRAFT_22257 [Crepidotus variabilis]